MSPNRLKIAIVAPPWLPVPPERYGGVEWVVSLLADRLAEFGHGVTLDACGGSITLARLESTAGEANILSYGQLLSVLGHALLVYREGSHQETVSPYSWTAAAS